MIEQELVGLIVIIFIVSLFCILALIYAFCVAVSIKKKRCWGICGCMKCDKE